MRVAEESAVLITCPNAHEWWVKVEVTSPPQPQTVACPLCEEPYDVMLPRIVKVDAL